MYAIDQNRAKSQISNGIVTHNMTKWQFLDTFPHGNMPHSHNILYAL